MKELDSMMWSGVVSYVDVLQLIPLRSRRRVSGELSSPKLSERKNKCF